MEGKKSDQCQFTKDVFNSMINCILKNNVDPIPNIKKAMLDLQSRKIDSDLLKISKVLGQNPEDYPKQGCQQAQIGNKLGLRKGDLIQFFDADKKETGHSWTLNSKEYDISKYKRKTWNRIVDILEAAGYPIQDLAKEFDINTIKKSKIKIKKNSKNENENGHNDAEPPSGVTG